LPFLLSKGESWVFFVRMPSKITLLITPQEDELFPRRTLYYMHTEQHFDEITNRSQYALGDQRVKGNREKRKARNCYERDA
jgi:hypothetical protein